MVKNRAKRKLSALCWVLGMSVFVCAPAFGQEVPVESRLETPRGMGLGMAGSASGMGSSAIAYNPAALATGRIYHLDTVVGYQGRDGSWSVGGTAADSVSNRLASGFSFRGLVGGDEEALGGIDARLGFGIALSPTVAIGVAGRYFRLTQPGQADEAETEDKGFTLDASLLFRPTDGLAIAILSHGLIPTDTGLVPMQVGGGISYSVGGMFTLASDCLVDLSTFENASVLAGAGLEYLAGDVAPVRVGYRYDSGRDQHFLSGGLGYVQQQYSADIGVRHPLSGEGGLELSFALRYHHQ